MTVNPSTHRQLAQRGSKNQFLVHLLKITRVPSPVPTFDVAQLSKPAGRNALKVTALYGSKQVALGDFLITKNECIIDQQLTCQLDYTKPEAQSKLHFYIDQACSSGLTGHIAVDLKEFLHEGDTEVYLKYPLYANTSRQNRVPMLKMTVQCVGNGSIETAFDEDSDVLVLQRQSVQMLQANNTNCPEMRLNEGEEADTLQNSVSSHGESLRWKERVPLHHLAETRLLKLEGALSELDAKLKTLASAYKTTECSGNRQSISGEGQSVSSAENLSSPSSLPSRVFTDRHQELCEKLHFPGSLVPKDVGGSYSETESVTFPHTVLKHSRTSSDITCLASSPRCPEVVLHKRNLSIDEVSSDFWYTQSSSTSDGDYEHQECSDCFVCSTNILRSYEGLYSGLSRSGSDSLSPGLSPQLRNATLKRQEEIVPPEPRKGPGLLRSIFGAVVVAGVSLLGVRSASLIRREKPRAGDWAKVRQPAIFSYSEDLPRRSSTRNHYSSRSLL